MNKFRRTRRIGGRRTRVGGKRTRVGGKRTRVGGRRIRGGKRTRVGGKRTRVGGHRIRGGKRTRVGGTPMVVELEDMKAIKLKRDIQNLQNTITEAKKKYEILRVQIGYAEMGIGMDRSEQAKQEQKTIINKIAAEMKRVDRTINEDKNTLRIKEQELLRITK